MPHFRHKVQNDLFGVLLKAKEIAETNAGELLMDYGNRNVEDKFLKELDEIPLYLNTSVEDIGKLSFTTHKRITHNSWDAEESGCPSNRQRVKAKVGRVLNRIFTTSYLEERGVTNNDIEVLTSQLKSLWSVDESCFSISEDFYKYEYPYTCEDAQHEVGTLGDSCMRHSECVEEGYFDMYESSDTPVKMVVYDEGDGITSRALLWDIGGGEKLLDRIYQTYDGDIDKFKMYAKNNGWWYKEKQTYGNKTGWVNLKGDIVKQGFIVPCEDFENLSNFPYLDTFTFGFYSEGDCQYYLTNCMKYAYEQKGVTEFREFSCTGGGYSSKEGREVITFTNDLSEEPRLEIDFRGDWFYLNERQVNHSEFLNEEGYYNITSTEGDRIIKRITHEGNDSYFHISELRMCQYDGNYYHKSKKFVSADRGNDSYSEVPESKTCILNGVVRLKTEVICYCDRYDKNVTVFNFQGEINTITDVFGVTRNLSDCVRTEVGRMLKGHPLVEMIKKEFANATGIEGKTRKLSSEVGNYQF